MILLGNRLQSCLGGLVVGLDGREGKVGKISGGRIVGKSSGNKS